MQSLAFVCLTHSTKAFTIARSGFRSRALPTLWNAQLQPIREYRSDGPEYVYGVAPVRLALSARRRKIHELYIQEGMEATHKKDKSAVDAIQHLAASLSLPIRHCSKHDLNLLTDSRPHQGFVLKSDPLKFEQITELPTAQQAGNGDKIPCWLVLDEVLDPQNFGALLRTAHFLGADGVVTCARNSAPLNPVVSKASAGAMELIRVHSAENMMKFLDKTRGNGWEIIGAALESSAVEVSSLEVTKPTVLVLGNEGKGLRTNVKQRCTKLVKISGATSDKEAVDSLNVSVTGGILLHHIVAASKRR